MEKVRRVVKRILVVRASLLRKAWVNIILFLLAGAMIVSGIYLSSQTGGTKRADIKWYNQGVAAYNATEYWIPPENEDLIDPKFPLENLLRAAAYFQQAASESTDNSLKTLALYNLGTLIGRDYLVFMEARSPELGMATGISKLAEAIRIDPNNEDAKYNLELLEKVQESIAQQGEITSGLGYIGGAAIYVGAEDKGY
jgi:hypothetical protein